MAEAQQPPKAATPSVRSSKKGGGKRSAIERERDYADIAVLMLKGRTKFEITAWIGANRAYSLSDIQVRNDMQEVLRRWRETAFLGLDEQRRIEVAKIERVEREAWDAWENSKMANIYKSSTRRETEVGKDEDGKDIVNAGSAVKTVASRTQSGESRFLDIVMRCIEKRCSLLGLDAPKQAELNVRHSVVKGLPDEHIDRILSEHYHNASAGHLLSNGQAGNGEEAGPEVSDTIHEAL